MTHAPRRAAHRVAVIGHGAAAIETSDLLICIGDYFVDLFSKAPAPTCLIRFGSTHRASTGSGGSGRDLVPRLRLFGNIRIGAGEDAVSIGELIHYYDTVIVADDAAAAGSSLVIVGNSPLASATYEFLRANTSLSVSRTPVVAAPEKADQPGAIITLLEARKLPFTTWTGWHRPALASEAVTAKQWGTLVAKGLAIPAVP
ncbi:hypothetical protein [uncultured Corynebacterium sp.]|mgnify:FL=1|uniref:hypothetical protein n=1 Tax=uncultured Corynebacterium sp. TaxID=159447 RepID=UPI0025F4B299|nr:hypothetical protein [uncultured Corynebacterium sp.]